MDHTRFGLYAEQSVHDGTIDVEMMQSHPAIRGTWRVDPHHGPNGFRILNDQVFEFVLETRERPDAQFVSDSLNATSSQFGGETAPTSAPSRIQRAAAIGVELHQKRAQVAALEATAGDGSAGRSVNQARVSGAAEHQRHEALTQEIDRLERELAQLEAA